MDRELLFGVLSGALCAPAVWLCSLLPVRPRPARADASAGAAEEERLRWRELVTPLVPAALIVAGLLGWAISEPADAESAGYLMWAVVPAGFVWFRSLVRAIKAALPADARHAAATVGLLRPRIVLREGLEHMLDARALAAAKAHEEAHVRHHDPLRMWLAQISTDLQWPFPGGTRRFRSWLHALEVARDDEAVASGVDPVDLAKAIVTCAAEGHYSTDALSAVSGEPSLLPLRIARLLDESVQRGRWTARPSLLPALVATGLVGAFALGLAFGERLVRALLAVGG